eukprot:scaffold81654_cov17-Prasinocladus_malaysianus.AAC.1
MPTWQGKWSDAQLSGQKQNNINVPSRAGTRDYESLPYRRVAIRRVAIRSHGRLRVATSPYDSCSNG